MICPQPFLGIHDLCWLVYSMTSRMTSHSKTRSLKDSCGSQYCSDLSYGAPWSPLLALDMIEIWAFSASELPPCIHKNTSSPALCVGELPERSLDSQKVKQYIFGATPKVQTTTPLIAGRVLSMRRFECWTESRLELYSDDSLWHFKFEFAVGFAYVSDSSGARHKSHYSHVAAALSSILDSQEIANNSLAVNHYLRDILKLFLH